MNDKEMRLFVTNLCNRYGVPDLPGLYATEKFRRTYAEQATASPGADRGSLTGKALYAMRFIPTAGASIKAWCLEPNYVEYAFDKDAPKGAQKSKPSAVGVMLVTPDGSQKFIEYGKYDGTKPFTGQAPQGGWIPGLARAAPVTLNNINLVEDLLLGTQTVKLTEVSKATVGGHNDPFPNAPNLDNVAGQRARKEGWGAFKADKKTGTIRGRFGDNDGENKFVTFTFPADATIKVWDRDVDRGEHVIQSNVVDSAGGEYSLKLPLYEVLSKLGRPEGTPPEAIIALLRSGRVLCRGQGSILAGKSPEDFGFDADGWAATVVSLSEREVLKPVGSKSALRRLHLGPLTSVDAATGEQTPATYIPVGDKKVYDIVEKKGGVWELSTLVWDEKRLPWFSVKTSDKAREGKEKWNTGSFFEFLDGLSASNLPDDDPMLQMVKQMPLPEF